MCAKENIHVIPIPGACAVVAALSASGLDTDEFTFGNFPSLIYFLSSQYLNNLLILAVGFLPKHSGTRKERLVVSSNETRTQIFYVPPHKLSQFLDETTPFFGESRFISLLYRISML